MIADGLKTDDRLSGRELAIVVAALGASLLAAPIALPSAPRDSSQPVALVFAPWLSTEAAFDRALGAGYRVLRRGSAPFVVIAVGDEVRAGPRGLMARLALDGLAGCLDPGRLAGVRS